jgi:hypothetical protein
MVFWAAIVLKNAHWENSENKDERELYARAVEIQRGIENAKKKAA